jgi:hypothetical protein
MVMIKTHISIYIHTHIHYIYSNTRREFFLNSSCETCGDSLMITHKVKHVMYMYIPAD